MITTEPTVITGAKRATIMVRLGAGVGKRFVLPATNRVNVTVIVPATVPCWIAPFCKRVGVVAPTGM